MALPDRLAELGRKITSPLKRVPGRVYRGGFTLGLIVGAVGATVLERNGAFNVVGGAANEARVSTVGWIADRNLDLARWHFDQADWIDADNRIPNPFVLGNKNPVVPEPSE